MTTTLFSYDAPRARDARMHVLLSGWLRTVLLFATFVALGLGAWWIIDRDSLGWLAFGFSIFFLVPLLWDERHLKTLPVTKGDMMHDRLEPTLLAHLPSRLDRNALVANLSYAQSVQFMMVRAGISPQFISESYGDNELEAAWKRAVSRKPSVMIYGADLFASLIASDDSLTALLPHLQLEQNDIDLVADWYAHLQQLIEYHSEPHVSGGIARDWSFGYSHLLERFGVNVSDQVGGGSFNVDIEAHNSAIDFMVSTLATSGKANVALVGPVGAGKTTIIEGFAERLMKGTDAVPAGLRYRQVVQLSAATLISAASGRGELEQLVNELLVEAYKAKNIIVCLDDAELFFEEGVGSVDLANILRPALEGGALKIIFTMEEQRYLKISQRNPALAQLLNRFMVQPASYDETMRVMQDQLIPTEFRRRVTYMYQALRESYRLSERYLHDLAQPGKALQVLISAAQYAEDGLVTAASVQKSVEQSFGVKVSANAGQDEKEMLLNLEARIHERMINQTRAVGVVSDALRRARAGVRNEKRPIGTFLFLGPTGVGKTELAKALAAIYFGGEDRLVRLDMNEFVSPDDVRRLIADGADDASSLSAQILKQPFAVVLLDEIEKAHDAVLSTLLQVLDEGILRDVKGREVSFRDAIIIATSNAGAEQIRHHIEAGEELQQFEKEFEDELIRSKEFRPEFLNRFDEVVLFRPLSQIELAKVVDLIIDSVNATLESQKVRVAIDTELKAWLVVKGNDPRLGARPMRRMVQRVVENIIAKRLLAGEAVPGQTISLTLADIPEEMK